VLLVLRPTGLSAAGDDEGAAVPIRRPTTTPHGRWAFGALVAVALVYPLLDRALGVYAVSVATSILIFGLLSLGLNLLVGMAGLLDLGYAAIFAIGGYTAALLTSGRLGALDFPLVLLACVLTTALFGALNGALTLRLRGEYLAIVTLAFGQIIPRVFVNLDRWTSGSRGIAALPPPRLFGVAVQTQAARYYLALAALALVAGAVWRLSRSRLGRAWAALSMDEMAALSSGVPLRERISAFMVSAAIAGVAGALFATIFSYVNTDQSDVSVSAMLLAMVIIGGAGSVRGAIVGALVIAGANQFAISRVGAWVDRHKAELGGWLGQIAAAVDLRSLSYLFFGLVLYGTVFLREREGARRTEV
jgi:branched-chain amino acid transport system permease protein